MELNIPCKYFISVCVLIKPSGFAVYSKCVFNVWAIAFGLESYKTNEMQETTAKSLGVWKCLCKSYRYTESQYGYIVCLNSSTVTSDKFHHFPGGLKLFL